MLTLGYYTPHVLVLPSGRADRDNSHCLQAQAVAGVVEELQDEWLEQQGGLLEVGILGPLGA